MRLRQIRIAGFKSFADPTVIELNDPVVGIVGPNGCGKSNVIDAVRWVLGEGRVSELRGSATMSELIFSGSAGRAPMGRASVELVLENRDGRVKGPWGAYAELSIRRLVTREGQSVYSINHQQVRRRDVQEIFLGTGLGSRSYAIISQGMISNFIRAKPEELRVCLEEAAGVSLYKERRRETESLLRSTTENLERAADLQAVRGEEIGRLRADAETARKWKTLTEKKNASEGLWYFLQYEEARRSRDAAASEARGLEDEISQKKAAASESEAARPALQAELDLASGKLSEAQGAVRRAETDLARHEGEVKRLLEREREAQKGVEEAEKEILRRTARIEDTERAAKDDAGHLEALAETLETLEAQVLEGEEAVENWMNAADEATGRKNDAARGLDDCRRRHAAREAAARALEARIRELAQRRSRMDNEAEEKGPSEKDLRLAREALEAAVQRFERAEAAADEGAAMNEAARAESRAADEHYFSTLSDLKAESSRLTALEDLHRTEGAAGGFAEWLEAQGLSDLPAFSDEIEVGPEAMRAVEAVLGVRARALLLRDLRSGAGLEKNRPPAPLVFAEPDEKPAASLRIFPGTDFEPLGRFVRSKSPAAQALLSEALGNAWLAPGVREALAHRKALPPGGLFVTPEGDVATGSTLSFFASGDSGSTLLTRGQEIRELKKSVEALERELAGAEEAREAAHRRELAVSVALDAARQGLAAATAEKGKAERALERLETEFAATERRIADRKRSAEELEREEAERKAELEEAMVTLEEDELALESAQKAFGRLERETEDARRRLTEAERRLALARGEKTIRLTELERARKERALRGASLEELRRDLEREKARREGFLRVLSEVRSNDWEAETQRQVEALRHFEALEAEAAIAHKNAQEKLSANEQVARELQAALLPLSERLSELRVTEASQKGLAEQFSARMDELHVDWTASAVLARERNVKAVTVRNEVLRLMKEIEAMGPVNHAALEQLEAAESALEAARLQIEDLQKAVETLEAAVRRIDAETRSRMRETFGRVRENFGLVFRELFGGGRADLTMTGEEILNTGIEVTAQPPGKRNASVRLLSGGEQALTATALVFALFRLNPAPFCLLDEVDAPLDEANQARLAELCLRMSGETQFVLITHHRVTMEYARALIGVTMREPGVSRVVSVDIEEASKYALSGGEA